MDALKQVALKTGDVGSARGRLAKRLIEIHRRNDDLWLLQFAVFELGYADLARMRLDGAFGGVRGGTLDRQAHRRRGERTSLRGDARSRSPRPVANTTSPSNWGAVRSTWLVSSGTVSGPRGRRAGSARRCSRLRLSRMPTVSSRLASRRRIVRARTCISCDVSPLAHGLRTSSANDDGRPSSRPEPKRSSTGSASVLRRLGSPDTMPTSTIAKVGGRRAGRGDRVDSAPKPRSSRPVEHVGGATESWMDRWCSPVRRSVGSMRTRRSLGWRAPPLRRRSGRGSRPHGERIGCSPKPVGQRASMERAAKQPSKADRAVAHLAERIHDRTIRDTFLSAGLGEASSGGVER